MRDMYQRRNSAPAIRTLRRSRTEDDEDNASQGSSSNTDLSPRSRYRLNTIWGESDDNDDPGSEAASNCPSRTPTLQVLNEVKSTMDMYQEPERTPSRQSSVQDTKPLMHQDTLSSLKQHHQRLVDKDGTCNVAAKRITKRYKMLVADIFTTIFDMQWRYLISVFVVVFIGSWFFFALLWYIQAMVHGDYNALNDTDWPSCVANVYDYPTALLFSIETQHTIGYGSRVVEMHCGFSFILLMLQACYGILAQTLVTGLVFAKLLRPKRRAKTMMFSEKAVINLRDDGYCFLFRVADIRRSHIIATSMRAMLVRSRLTKEGESIPLCQFVMALETEADFGDNFVFLGWPATVVHRITSISPLWEMSQKCMGNERFEIIVILEGTIENTGMMTQFRTSYLPDEIEWGARLTPLVTYSTTSGPYDIDFSQFNALEYCSSMPDCSAKTYADQRAEAAAVAAVEAANQDNSITRFPASLVVGRAMKRPPSIPRLLINRCKKAAHVKSTQSIGDLGCQQQSGARALDLRPKPQTMRRTASSRTFDPQPMMFRVKTHNGLQQFFGVSQDSKPGEDVEDAIELPLMHNAGAMPEVPTPKSV